MSDSDDTDVLLLIPPDLFVVPSSDSEGSAYRGGGGYSGSGVVSKILEHVQSLESRVTAIESRDESPEVSLLDASLESQSRSMSHPIVASPRAGQAAPRSGYNHHRLSSLPVTPAKSHCRSFVNSSPGSRRSSPCVADAKRNESRTARRPTGISDSDFTDANSRRAFHSGDSRHGSALDFAASNSSARRADGASRSAGTRLEDRRDIKEMELSEVDELLQEMEATEIELAKRIDNSNSHRYINGSSRNTRDDSTTGVSFSDSTAAKTRSPMRRLDFEFFGKDTRGSFDAFNFRRSHGDKIFADVSLPDENALRLEETEKIISGFKIWEPRDYRNVNNSSEGTNFPKTPDKINSESSGIDNRNIERLRMADEANDRRVELNSPSKPPENRTSLSSETSGAESRIPSNNSRSLPNIQHSVLTHSVINSCDKSRAPVAQTYNKVENTADSGLPCPRPSQRTNDSQQVGFESGSPTARHTVQGPRKSQRVPTLSDFWDLDGTKTQEEMLPLRLEEEKFRREHCEHVIQELQKRLLEQQEKVAVAIRVDSEKNVAISQFQNAWSVLKQKYEALEKEHSELEAVLKSAVEKHESETAELQQQLKRREGELSKTLDLAAGYKEKSDTLINEKLDLLKGHADELEKYKSLVQEAEQRYENLKLDCSKLLEKSKHLEELNNSAQQELNKERLRSSEVRNEMAVIHKALDACEAELTILRQEKESLYLKIKEEGTRNGILEQNKAAYLQALNEAKAAETAAKEESKALADRQELIRSELRQVYQNQVDEVVKTKLEEFQQQLDAAEMTFQVNLETRQRAIAECAARKIKSIIDKHQLEINLLEEKQMEEKRLYELQLAQASQKAAALESQLSMQRATKTQLAEQLHSVMQKQWQEALQIISGGNVENLSSLERPSAERFFDAKKSKHCNSACCNKDGRPVRAELRSPVSQNLQNLQSTNSRQEQDESLITLTSNDEIPLTTRKESKDDLRKYIKMILDMQQPKDDFRTKYIEQGSSSPPPVTREVPRKHYVKKELNSFSEQPATWQHIDEQSVRDTNEYIPTLQPQGQKSDQQRNKPPWK